jgi:hypothetical protein
VQVTAIDEASATALGQFLEERGCAVYRSGATLEASPLGSVDAARIPSQLAGYLKEWLARQPGSAVRLVIH